MDSGILKMLNFIEDIRVKMPLHKYLETKAELVNVGDNVYIGFSPFDELPHDNYLDRRLIVKDNKYYCLSTGKSGDIMSFIMEEKKLSFKEAVSDLASMIGEKLPDIEGEVEERVRVNEHKERLYALMRDTMLHYFNNLRDPRAKIAVDYLEKRGFGNVLTEDATGRIRITYH